MIRRDATGADGSPVWVLISQIDHARLAGELAEDWRWEGEAPAEPGIADPLHPLSILVPTIYRHDDGWRAWESAPTIDPATGRPHSFLAMPNAVAHEIWRKSIAGVADLGPLAQYVVAEHFCRLRRGSDTSDDREVHAFLNEYDELCQQWLAQWRALDTSRNTLAASTRAVDWLQFFDLFSLWLCMAERREARQFTLPGGEVLSFTPEPPAPGGQIIRAHPWPWRSATRTLTVRGRAIPARPLASDEQLHQALAASQAFEQPLTFAPQR